MSANNGKRQGRRGANLQQVDENSQSMILEPVGVSAGAKNNENFEQEIRSLKFELAQQNEILTLKTETLKNVQE